MKYEVWIEKSLSFLHTLPEGTKISGEELLSQSMGRKDILPFSQEDVQELEPLILERAPQQGLLLEQLPEEPGYYLVHHQRLREKMDRWDYLISIASGVMTAALDVLRVGEISLEDAHDWGKEKTERFVKQVAKMQGYKGDNLAEAIKTLEDKNPIPADLLTNDFGGGFYHHLRDFSHHPTLTGLLFSILTQFTGRGWGTDVNGTFVQHPIPGWQRPDLLTGIYNGTVTWFFHMVSDMAGSSSSARLGKEGTGLPGAMMSLLKEISSLPGIRSLAGTDEKGHYNFSVTCSKLFQGTLLGERDEAGTLLKAGVKFDLRTELGIANEAVKSKQYLPVLINEGIVTGFYSVTRFVRALERHPVHDLEDLKRVDIRSFLPWGSLTLKHMRTLSSVTFSVIDLGTAGLQAYVKSQGNPGGFALYFLRHINYIGVARLELAAFGELTHGAGKLYGMFEQLARQQKARLLELDPGVEDKWAFLKQVGVTAGAISQMGTPVGFVSAAIGVYDEISNALEELHLAREERIRMEQECRLRLQILRENQREMELAVEQYMQYRLTVFGGALDQMEQALQAGDSDAFLAGNVQIQRQLGQEQEFADQQEFDAFMDTDLPLKL